MSSRVAPTGLCECGCGERTRVATQTFSRSDVRAGEPMRFIRGHNRLKLPSHPVVAGQKLCAACGLVKSVEAFAKNAGAPSGYRGRCRACEHERRSASNYAYDLKQKYGLSIDDYYAMFEAQGGCCKICQEPPSERRLAVDHCHTTGRVRGLLCVNCNSALGRVKDDPTILHSMIEYLAAIEREESGIIEDEDL